MKRRNIIALILCTAVVLALAACSAASAANDTPDDLIGGDPSTWGPTDHSSLAEAEAAAGIDMQIPEKILDTKASMFLTWYNEKCIEAIYANGDEEVARVRKDEGSADISGDYNDYSSVVDREINGVSVTFKGNDGKVMLAVWAVDGCGYSISVPNGITADEMAALVGQVK